MMNLIVLDGDNLVFIPAFGAAIVTPTGPAMIRGSGHATVQSRRICVAADAKKVQVNAMYISGAFSIPGNGIITISALAANQEAKRCTTRGGIIVKGVFYQARFKPTKPAQQPPPANTPDPIPFYSGQGQFITRQILATAKA